MRAQIMAALVVMFLFTACKKEPIEKSDESKITTVVTIDYGGSKVVELIYQGKLVWQSEPNVTLMTYLKSEDTDTIQIDYVCSDGSYTHVSFTGGKLNKK